MADAAPQKPAILKQKYDFAAPHVRATIVKEPNSRSPERFPLWTADKAVTLSGYTGVGERVESSNLSSLAYLTSATVEMELNCIPRLTVSLTPPFLEARKFIDSTVLDWGRSVLEIQLGYVGSKEGTVISRPYTGIIQKPEVSFGSDITIGLTAQGQAAFFLANNAPRAVRKAKVESTRQQLILAFIEQFKELGLVADTTQWRISEDSRELLDQVAYWVPSTLNTLDEIYNIARSCGCYLNLVGNEVQLVSFSYLVNDEPKFTLKLYDYDGQVGPQNGVYPILSVSSDSSQVFLSMATKGMLWRQIGDVDKKVKEASAKPSQQQSVSGKTSAQSGYTNEPREEALNTAIANLTHNGELDSATAKQLLNDAMTEEGRLGVSLTVETLGIPDLLPGFKVKVMGVSTRIDGLYMVYNIKHDISSSGFTTSLTLKSNFASLTQSLNTTYNAGLVSVVPVEPPPRPDGGGGDTTRATPKSQSGAR